MKIDYTVRFSNRRTVSVKITYDGKVIVTCPQGTSCAKIDGFISKKSEWINKHLSAISNRNSSFTDVINFKKILVGGKEYDFAIGDGDFFTDRIVVKDIDKLRKFYIDYFSSDFIKLFEEICFKTGLKANSVKFKDYKSRWGCCDGKNNIIFNYKIMMLPVDLQEYVIIHELCHTIQHNHSKKFWCSVGYYLPDYKLRIKAIKQYSFITRMY